MAKVLRVCGDLVSGFTRLECVPADCADHRTLCEYLEAKLLLRKVWLVSGLPVCLISASHVSICLCPLLSCLLLALSSTCLLSAVCSVPLPALSAHFLFHRLYHLGCYGGASGCSRSHRQPAKLACSLWFVLRRCGQQRLAGVRVYKIAVGAQVTRVELWDGHVFSTLSQHGPPPAATLPERSTLRVTATAAGARVFPYSLHDAVRALAACRCFFLAASVFSRC